MFVVAALLKTKSGYVGLLDRYGFNFTVLTPSNSSRNPLPLQIKLGGYLMGRNLNAIVLSQITGNSSFIKSQAWNAAGDKIKKESSAQTVRILKTLKR